MMEFSDGETAERGEEEERIAGGGFLRKRRR
jgi:hypothetical protein